MGDHCYWLSDSTSIILWNLTACSLRSQKKLKLKKRSWDFVFGIILRSPWGRRPSLWGCQSPSSNSRFQHSFASSIYPGSPGCSPSPVQVTCSEPQAAFDPKNTQIGFAESECVWLWFRFQFEYENETASKPTTALHTGFASKRAGATYAKQWSRWRCDATPKPNESDNANLMVLPSYLNTV